MGSTVAQALATARKTGLDKLDADLLLLFARGLDGAALEGARSWLLVHDTDVLDAPVLDRYRACVQRRLAGEPLAYIVGMKEFHGLPLRVDRHVLVPRPDTETLVDWALEHLRSMTLRPGVPALRVLDLGCGSGAIALAIRRNCPTCTVDAVDASAAALAVAQSNTERHGLPVRLLQGDWFQPVDGHYDCIVSNPPYVAEGDPHLHALAHEPAQALVSGPDGLRDIRQIVTDAPLHLADGGWLLLEHGHTQGMAVHSLLHTAGFQELSRRHDLAGHWRCSAGRWIAPRGTAGNGTAGNDAASLSNRGSVK